MVACHGWSIDETERFIIHMCMGKKTWEKKEERWTLRVIELMAETLCGGKKSRQLYRFSNTRILSLDGPD